MTTVSPTAPPYARTAGDGASIWYVGNLFTFLAEARDTRGQYALLDITGRAGLEPPPHTHTRDDEGFLVLEGEATFVIEGEELPAPAGTFVWAPRGKEHSFTFHSDTVRMLVVISPGGGEEAFRRIGQPAGYLGLPPMPTDEPDVERMVAIDAEYGVEYGPLPGE